MIEFLENKDIKEETNAVFQANGMSRRIGYQILQSSNMLVLKNDPTGKKWCGWKQIIIITYIQKMVKIFENKGRKDPGLIWS